MNIREDAHVEFTLEGAIAREVRFTRGQQELAFYPELTATVSRLFRMRNFSFPLGGIQYFEFDRKLNYPEFSGSFLFGQNPLGFETTVECSVHP